MRKVFSVILCIAALAALFCMASCNKQDTTADTSAIVGTWSESDSYDAYLFVAGGTCYAYAFATVSSKEKPIKGTYTYDGKTLNASLGDYSLNGAASIVAGTMTLTIGSSTKTFVRLSNGRSQSELEEYLK